MKMKRMTTKEMKELIEKAIAKKRAYVDAYISETNPQLVIGVARAQGQADALDAVLEALNGNPVFLRIAAG